MVAHKHKHANKKHTHTNKKDRKKGKSFVSFTEL